MGWRVHLLVVVFWFVCLHGLFVKGHSDVLGDLIQVSNGYTCGIGSLNSAAPYVCEEKGHWSTSAIKQSAQPLYSVAFWKA